MQDKAEYKQLIIPHEHRSDVLKMLHNDQVHQAVERVLSSPYGHFYLSTMCVDVNS